MYFHFKISETQQQDVTTRCLLFAIVTRQLWSAPNLTPNIKQRISSLSFSSLISFPPPLLLLLLLPLPVTFPAHASVGLGAFAPPGVNQLPDKQLLDQGGPRVSGVAAVGRGAVSLNHGAALQGVNLRRLHTFNHRTILTALQPSCYQTNKPHMEPYLHQQVKGGARLLTQDPELYTLYKHKDQL